MHRAVAVLLLNAWALSGAAISAQEELPPPPPAPAPAGSPIPTAPARGERLDRWRQFGGQLLNGLTSPTPGQAAGLGINVEQLNSGVEEIVAPVVSGDPALKSVRLYFDPQETNLAADRVTVVAAAALNHTAWSPQPSDLELHVRARVHPPSGGPLQAGATGRLSATTDVLALSNYAIPRLRDRLRSEIHPGAPDEEIKLRMLQRLEQTGQIRSLDELADLITSMASLNFLAKTEEIDRTRNELARTNDPIVRRDLAGRLEDLRFERDAMLAIRPVIVRGPDAAAAQIAIKLGDIRGTQGAYIDSLEISIAHNQIALSGQAGIGQGVELYLLAKPLIIGTLARMQVRDPATLSFQRGLVQQWWQEKRPDVVGETPPPQ